MKSAVELVSANIRRLKEGLTIEGLRESLDNGLKERKDLTLGRAIQEVTKGWFDGEPEAVSKLQVSRVYDDLVEALSDDAPKPAKPELMPGRELATDLHRRLKLPEKMASESIVE